MLLYLLPHQQQIVFQEYVDVVKQRQGRVSSTGRRDAESARGMVTEKPSGSINVIAGVNLITAITVVAKGNWKYRPVRR